MPDEIPTEALKAGIALARATKQVSQRPDRDIWVTDSEMELIRAGIRGAAPILIVEGRRQAERELRAKIAAEIRAGTGPGKHMPNNMLHAPWWSSLSGPYPAGFAEWAARIAEGFDRG